MDKLQSQRQNDANDDHHVADQAAGRNLFLEEEETERHYINVAGGFQHACHGQIQRTKSHHVEQHAAEEQAVGKNNGKVKVGADAGEFGVVRRFFQNKLAHL